MRNETEEVQASSRDIAVCEKCGGKGTVSAARSVSEWEIDTATKDLVEITCPECSGGGITEATTVTVETQEQNQFLYRISRNHPSEELRELAHKIRIDWQLCEISPFELEDRADKIRLLDSL